MGRKLPDRYRGESIKVGLISIDYFDAIRQANKLNYAAEQCENAERAANKAYAEVCESWSGEAADAFKVKIEEWKKENKRVMEECRDIAQLIKMVAKQIKEADEAAARTMQ